MAQLELIVQILVTLGKRPQLPQLGGQTVLGGGQSGNGVVQTPGLPGPTDFCSSPTRHLPF